MSTAKQPEKKTNPLVVVSIGCLVLLILAGVGTVVVMKFLANKIGSGLVENVIENQTGIKADLENGAGGVMTFTDEKTGATVNVGGGSIPTDFPKDFPIYPGAKVTSSLSGGQQENGNGFWVTLATEDTTTDVVTYYKTALNTNGWSVQASYTADDTTTQTVKKGILSGNISIMRADEGTTQIVIVLGSDTN